MILERGFLLPFAKMGLGKEGQSLLKNLLTTSELVMLGRRLQIARMLVAGFTFAHIQSKIHASPITIVSVDRWLEGKFRSYRRVLRPFRHPSDKPIDPHSFRAIHRKYPGHALLLNLLLGDPFTEKTY